MAVFCLIAALPVSVLFASGESTYAIGYWGMGFRAENVRRYMAAGAGCDSAGFHLPFVLLAEGLLTLIILCAGCMVLERRKEK